MVPKLLKFKARFPFFVRQVFIFGLECVHVCKVSHPKGPQNGPQFASRLQGICKGHVDDVLATARQN